MVEYFDPNPAPAIERLARIEGQSNFLSLLAGVEAGPNTTDDMMALGYANLNGKFTWFLEAYYAQSKRHDDKIVEFVGNLMDAISKTRENDRYATKVAIYSALRRLQFGRTGSLKRQAKALKMDETAYAAIRKLALSVMTATMDDAKREWEAIRGVPRGPTLD